MSVADTPLFLYGKPDCPLCEKARNQLQDLQSQLGFILKEVDITLDDELHKRYLERIPVAEYDGRELFEFFVDEAVIRSIFTSSL